MSYKMSTLLHFLLKPPLLNDPRWFRKEEQSKETYVYNLFDIIVTGFWKTSQIFILGLFHFIGPANIYTHTLSIRSVLTRLG